MDREKFDLKLQGKIQKFELQYSPVFDENLVWKKIQKKEDSMRWTIAAAASLILILGLSLLFQQFYETREITKLLKPTVKSKRSVQGSKPNYEIFGKAIVKQTQQNSDKTGGRLKDKRVLNNKDQLVAYEADTISLIRSAKKGVVEMPESVIVKSIEPTPGAIREQEIKVTFKRGSSTDSKVPFESKLTFKKFKLRIFENQLYDTSAYASGAEAEADRKIRFKF